MNGRNATHRIVSNEACDTIAEAAKWYAAYLADPAGYDSEEGCAAGQQASQEIADAIETIYGKPIGPVA